MTTPVIFKKFEGEITAVFPTLPGNCDPATMTCYAHVGQHGIAHQMWAAAAKPAHPREYKDLLAELVLVGYDDLVIRRRMTRQDHETRKLALQRIEDSAEIES